MDLPIYELKIQEELQDDAEVSFIALVDKPAIQRDFVAFSEENYGQSFAIQDEDKHIISGPLMLADKPIYRNNKTIASWQSKPERVSRPWNALSGSSR